MANGYDYKVASVHGYSIVKSTEYLNIKKP